MKNYIQPGIALDFVAATDLVGGQGLLLENTFGVVAGDALTGEDAVMDVVGVYDLPMAAVSPPQFKKAFWDDAAKLVTDVSTSNTLIGTFTKGGTSGDATINVRLSGYAV
ncbi:MAG: hypothetical protein COA70_02030 [Planctomycetota bacterium]|nr:MAG: hypothetical protein COA70_02030 [Planctomycetota bacterium]